MQSTEILKIKDWVVDACIKGRAPFQPEELTFEFSNRMTTTAGIAYGPKKLIKFSIPLIKRALVENPAEIKETVYHEIAHVIDYSRNLFGRGHGRTWRRIMFDMGYYNARRCHGITVQKRANAGTLVYTCPKCNATIHIGRKKRAQILNSPIGAIWCGRCKHPVNRELLNETNTIRTSENS